MHQLLVALCLFSHLNQLCYIHAWYKELQRKQRPRQRQRATQKVVYKRREVSNLSLLLNIASDTTARAIAPKNQTLIQQKKLQKKLSTSINDNIERTMASRAGATGKLTIMRKLAGDDPRNNGKGSKGSKGAKSPKGKGKK